MYKFLLTTTLTLALFAALHAQCVTPMPATIFATAKTDMAQAGTASAKLDIAMAKVSAYCMSSMQVKELAALFNSDADRLYFAKAAYDKTTDKANFYEVFDVFFYMSNIFRLRDYVATKEAEVTSTSPYTTTTSTSYSTATVISYPDVNFYYGEKGSISYMDNTTFNALLVAERAQATDIGRYTYVKSNLTGRMWTMEQLMRMVNEISSQDYRLDLLKNFAPNAYDRYNYGYGSQLLSSAEYKLNYQSHIASVLTPTVVVTTTTTTETVPAPIVDSFANCRVNDADYTSMKTSISKISFSSTKESQAQSILRQHCFTAAQIKGIVQLMSFESSKLLIAKYGYDYCIDKKNYYQINDAFSFSSSITDLNTYIMSK